jgi:hypothetical protein
MVLIRRFTRRQAGRFMVALASTALCLSQLGATPNTDPVSHLQGYLVVTDPPGFRFREIGWGYSNITNPLLLTSTTLDHDMMAISRISEGQTLPRGKKPFSITMSIAEIRDLVLEDLTDRGGGADIRADTTKVSGCQAIHVIYIDTSRNPMGRGVEYAFVCQKTLFLLIFVADYGSRFVEMRDDFGRLVSSFSADGCEGGIPGEVQRPSDIGPEKRIQK